MAKADFEIQQRDFTQGDRLEEARKAVEAKGRPDFKEIVAAAWHQETMSAAIFAREGRPDFVDENYNWREEAEYARLTQGIPKLYHQAFNETTSQEHSNIIRENILKELEREDTLERAGPVMGTSMRVLAALTDPTEWSIAAATGGSSLLLRGSRLQRMIRSGFAAGATNAAIEAYLAERQVTRGTDDILAAGLLGFAIGAPLGALSKAENAALRRAAADAHKRVDLDDLEQGLGLSPKGRQAADEIDTAASDVVEPVRIVPGPAKVVDEAGEPLAVKADEAVPARDAETPATPVKVEDDLSVTPAVPERAAARVGSPEVTSDVIEEMPEELRARPPEAAEPARADEMGVEEMPEELRTRGEAAEEAPSAAPSVGDTIYFTNRDGDVFSGEIRRIGDDGTFVVRDEDGKVRKIKPEDVEGVDARAARTVGDTPEEVPTEDDGFIAHGSIGSAQVGRLKDDETWQPVFKIGKWKIPLRFDYFAILDRVGLSSAKRLVRDLAADPVGDANYAASRMNASELSTFWHNTTMGDFLVDAHAAFAEYRMANNIGRLAAFRAEFKFYEDVTRILRGEKIDNPQAAKVAAKMRELQDAALAKAQKYGVEGADDVRANDNYVMRRFNYDRIVKLVQQFGAPEVTRLIAEAMQATRYADIDEAMRHAKNYLDTVMKLRYNFDANKIVRSNADAASIRDTLLRSGKMSDEDIDEVMEHLTGQIKEGGGGKHARLKSRASFDETYSTELRAKDGTTASVSIGDLFENDARVLMQIYSKQMHGLAALARVGIRKASDWDARVQEVLDEGAAELMDPHRLKKIKEHFEDIYSSIVGKPLSKDPFGTAERVGRIVRDLNFFRMMGQAGFAQMAEIGTTIGLAGWRASKHHMPALRDVMRMAKGGLIDDEFAHDIRKIGGFGTESLQSHPYMREIEEMGTNANLSRAELVAQYGKWATAHAGGLLAVNNVLRQFIARAFVQKLTDYAHGVSKVDMKAMRKLATAGVDEHDYESMFEALRKYTTRDKDGAVTRIDFDRWHAEDMEGAEAFKMTIWSEARRAVQEHTIGETAPWMHTLLGKILTQFRTFSLVAHGKQTLYGVHHMDFHTFLAWSLGSLFAGLSYVAQTSLNFAHNPEEREKRLDDWEIAKAAFQRAGYAGLIPMGIDSSFGFLTGSPVFGFGRSTSLGTGAITGNPTFDLLFTKGAGTASNAAQSLLTSDHEWTKKDVKNGLGLLLPNYVGVRNIIDSVSQEFPARNTLRDYQQ